MPAAAEGIDSGTASKGSPAPSGVLRKAWGRSFGTGPFSLPQSHSEGDPPGYSRAISRRMGGWLKDRLNICSELLPNRLPYGKVGAFVPAVQSVSGRLRPGLGLRNLGSGPEVYQYEWRAITNEQAT